jgi:hypothetical protein
MRALARTVWGALRTLGEILFWLVIIVFWPFSIAIALWRAGRALEAIALHLDSLTRSEEPRTAGRPKEEHTSSSQEEKA